MGVEQVRGLVPLGRLGRVAAHQVGIHSCGDWTWRWNVHRIKLAGRRVLQVVTVCMLAVLLLISPSANAGRLAQGRAVVEILVDPALLLQYQGRLLDPGTGDPKPDGSYQMILRLYDAATGGSILWSETKDVAVSDGLFTTFLGDAVALDLSDFDGEPLWLSVTVGADPEATPRQRVTHVAYALHAEDADTVDGQEAAEFAAAVHDHAAADIASGTLATDRFSAYDDLAAENKIGSGNDQVASGGHDHDERYYTESESEGRYVNDNAGEVGDADVVNGGLSPAKIVGTAWTSTNDGSGSGLDADRLDGQHATSFASASHGHDGLPLAYAVIKSDGTKVSGTANVSSTWNSFYKRYEVTISRVSYFWSNYQTMVTAMYGCGNVAPVTGSVSGKLLIHIYNPSGTLVQCDFQFVTFQP